MDIESLHYSMQVQWSDKDQVFIITIPELPGCKVRGKSQDETLELAKEAIGAWIENAQAHGEPIPPPRLWS